MWKHFAGQQGRGTRSVKSRRLTLFSHSDTLSNSRRLSVGIQGAGLVCLAVCVFMCEYEWVGGRHWCITHQQALSPSSSAKIRPSRHTNAPNHPQHQHISALHYPTLHNQPLCFADTWWNLLQIHPQGQHFVTVYEKARSVLESTLDVAWEWLGWDESDFEVFDRAPCLWMSEWKYEAKRWGWSLSWLMGSP